MVTRSHSAARSKLSASIASGSTASFRSGPKLGASHCVAVGNGTDALEIALAALEIGVNDEVIVPANTFFATAEAVSNVGARPVFVDCEPQYYNIDVSKIEEKITPRTKAAGVTARRGIAVAA